MKAQKAELEALLSEKQKQFMRYYIASISFILLFYAVLYYFLNFKIDSYINIVSFFVMGLTYLVISHYQFDYERIISLGLLFSTILVYIQVLIFWKSFPIVYLWFFSVPICVLMLKSFKETIYWAIAISILALSPPVVSKLLNIHYMAVFSHEESIIVNLSVVVFNIYLILFFLYYFNEFNSIKLIFSSIEGQELGELKMNSTKKELEGVPKKEVTISEEKLNELFDAIEVYFNNNNPHRDPDFSINKLATDIGTNISYISKALSFKKGTNFKTYLNSFRIHEIKEKLNQREHEKYTLKHIYTNSGFLHQSTFNRVFKEIEGVTPSEYIENIK
jgi:AraC-like DNA-binding protein